MALRELAAKAESIEELAAEISDAEKAGADESELRRRRIRLNMLRKWAEKRQQAGDACARAAGSNDSEMLEAAVAFAAKAGIDEGALAKAKRRLQVLWAEAAERTRVEMAILNAEGRKDARALEACIQRAERVGAGERTVSVAREKLAALEGSTAREAELSLGRAMVKVELTLLAADEVLPAHTRALCIGALREAILLAEGAGVVSLALMQARTRLHALSGGARNPQYDNADAHTPDIAVETLRNLEASSLSDHCS